MVEDVWKESVPCALTSWSNSLICRVATNGHDWVFQFNECWLTEWVQVINYNKFLHRCQPPPYRLFVWLDLLLCIPNCFCVSRNRTELVFIWLLASILSTSYRSSMASLCIHSTCCHKSIINHTLSSIMAAYRSIDSMSTTLVGKSIICEQSARQPMHAMDMVSSVMGWD
jgi:hypothetical protein